jgi:hypothetical protein
VLEHLPSALSQRAEIGESAKAMPRPVLWYDLLELPKTATTFKRSLYLGPTSQPTSSTAVGALGRAVYTHGRA